MTRISDLTVLSYGAGQDSTALLLLYVNDPEFRKTYAPGKFVVVMADTGDEHPYTNQHVAWTKDCCQKHNIPFFHLTSDQGFFIGSWPDLITPQLREEGGKYTPTLVQRGSKTCTLNLKIGPIYKWLDEYVNELAKYGYTVQKRRGCSKQALLRYGYEFGKIRMLIGYGKGEERRQAKSLALQKVQWGKRGYWQHIQREFPLIDMGWDRERCRSYIEGCIGHEVMPSNCMRCPYMSDEELLWLYHTDRGKFQEWVLMEQRKISRQEGVEKNYGIFRSKETLPERLQKVQAKYAHYGMDRLMKFLDAEKKTRGCGAGHY